MSSDKTPQANEAPTNHVNDLIGVGAALVVIATIGLLLISPWFTHPPGGMLTRYAPARDGGASLLAEYDAAGTPVAWHSQSVAILSKARALAGQLRPAMRDVTMRHFGQEGVGDYLARFAGLDFVEYRQTILQSAGDIQDTRSYAVRDERGEWLIGLYDPRQATPDTTFDPPLLNLPANLSVGNTWQTEGQVSNGLRYLSTGRVSARSAYTGTAQTFADCVQVETSLSLTNTQSTAFIQRSTMWYCDGPGLVEERDFDAQNVLTARYALVAGEQITPMQSQLPPVPHKAAAPSAQSAAPDFTQWRYTRVGRLGQEIAAGSSTIPPTWIPADPPIVLAAGYNGDLTAFDGADPSGVARWSFHAAGMIYSPPGYWPERNRIYFGATDKHLYALDARGLFVWAFQAGDSIASRPLVVSDTLIFGSEDRMIYALNADTGALRWQVKTGGAVVSSPALAGTSTVVIGSDDGGVYALDAASGEQQWLFTAGDAIEAPLVVQQGVVYAASRDNVLYAIDASTGQPVWEADAGEVLRLAPAIGDANVYLVDDGGRLHAFDRLSGKSLWATNKTAFVGTPILRGDALLVAGRNGDVYRFKLDGTLVSAWQAGVAAFPTDDAPHLDFGPTLGDDGALWLADDSAVIRRIGPAQTGATALVAAWERSNTEALFQSFFYASVADYKGQALLVDATRNIYALNPGNGQARLIGTLNASGAPAIDPVVSGDTLLVPAGGALSAAHLPDGRPLWQVKTGGLSLHPAIVAGDTALMLAEQPADDAIQDAPKQATLFAIDLASGALRWQQTVSGFNTVGNVVADVARGVVYVSTPPAAFDLYTGRRLWQADDTQSTGGGALSAQGETLFVGIYDPPADSGVIVALNAADGTLRWQTPLPKDVLATLDAPHPHADEVIVPLLSGKVIALDASSGAQRWRYAPAQLRFGNLSVIGKHVWLALQDGELIALDAMTGTPAARYSNVALSLAGYSFAQHPVRVGDSLIAVLGIRLIGLESGD
jgi:outer membrane protein assembly factor BamB